MGLKHLNIGKAKVWMFFTIIITITITISGVLVGYHLPIFGG